MPKRSRRSRDPNVRAFNVVKEAVGNEPFDPSKEEEKKNPAAVALGRLGGKKGGKARAARMTAAERSEAARKAAQARWDRERLVAKDEE